MHSLTFLPGTLLDAASVAELGTLLQATSDPVRVETLGECASFDAEIARLADSVTGPQVWIGHSLGGIFAINLAIMRPESCAALICISSTARADAPGNRTKRLDQLQRAQNAGSCEPISLEMKPVFGVATNSAWATSLKSQAARVGLRRFGEQTQYALTRPERRAAGSKLNCPVLAIVGGDDEICPPALSYEIASLGARSALSRCVEISGAGHLAPMTHPNEIAAHISEFLAALEPVNAPLLL